MVLLDRCLTREENLLKLALFVNNPDLSQYYYARYSAIKELKAFMEARK